MSAHRLSGSQLPDSRKPLTKRGFKLAELVVESRVAWREESGDLVDTEERIGVEDEGDEELTEGDSESEKDVPCV